MRIGGLATIFNSIRWCEIIRSRQIPSDWDNLNLRMEFIMKRAQFSRLWVVYIFLLAVWPAYMLAIADQGPSPLHLAVVSGNLQNVVDLVNGGMDVNVRDKIGVTPLMIASMKGNLEVARFLVSKGASVDAREDTGFTALMCAATSKSAELAAFLLKNAPPLISTTTTA